MTMDDVWMAGAVLVMAAFIFGELKLLRILQKIHTVIFILPSQGEFQCVRQLEYSHSLMTFSLTVPWVMPISKSEMQYRR